jgi:hypothetical protein
VSQRSAGPTVGRTICAGHVAEPTARRRHRTVRCAPDMSGAPTALRLPTVDCAVYGKKSDTGQCPVCTGLSGVHRTVRCAPDMSSAPTALRMPTVDCAVYGKKSGTGHVRCAPDCPVRQSIEGKISLPRLLSTAPSCLGAIKGTPRRMEEYIKHLLSIPKHQDIDSAPLILCDSN